MKAHYLLPIILVLALPALGKPLPSARSRVAHPRASLAWIFDIREDRAGNPRGRVFLRVARRRVLISRNVSGHYHVLRRQDYAAHRVPSSAVTACAGWWAGQGEDLYMIRRPGRLRVFRRNLDESAPTPAARLIRTISLR